MSPVMMIRTLVRVAMIDGEAMVQTIGGAAPLDSAPMKVALGLLLVSVSMLFYTYAGYPLLLHLYARRRHRRGAPAGPRSLVNSAIGEPLVWPLVSITVPVYNEEAQIRGLLESLLALDYPPERRQILIVSDASSDRTDEIVAEYADRGIELLRLERRSGKTAAENAARARLRGEIVVNTDASIRIDPRALKLLVARFADQSVGVASARDISVARAGADPNAGESGYVGYEMKVRELEDRIAGIIGASGCCYAIRAWLHRLPLPDSLSRDFSAALHAREHGYRATSVTDAVCYVPRAGSLQREYRRKVRTILRGMQTLHFKRHLLNPLRHGVFAWMLFSHKVCRWLVPWVLLVGGAGVSVLAVRYPPARWLLIAGLGGAACAAAGWYWPAGRKPPRIIAIPAYLVLGNLAALHASVLALRGVRNPVWEPTRRDLVRIATGSTAEPQIP
jgi:cellulose synthase/poly-beta-1,6-N-acetylglucosamine synthase-like glycosyltransferase